MKNKNSNKKSHVDPTRKHIKIMSSQTPLILIDGEEINIKGPHPQGSDEENAEVKIIKKAITNSSMGDFDFANIADKKIIELFKSFALENGLRFDSGYYSDLVSQLKTPILKLKYRFNRQRPWHRIKDYRGERYESTGTPSYPSGHAIQAYVIANILSRENPKLRDSLKMLADRISLSRVQVGVHYPSDIFMGEEVANMLDTYIVGPEKERDFIYARERLQKHYKIISKRVLSRIS